VASTTAKTTKTMPKGGRKGFVRDGTEGRWPRPRHRFWFRAAGGDASDDDGIKQPYFESADPLIEIKSDALQEIAFASKPKFFNQQDCSNTELS
jgi:hypothetical protein